MLEVALGLDGDVEARSNSPPEEPDLAARRHETCLGGSAVAAYSRVEKRRGLAELSNPLADTAACRNHRVRFVKVERPLVLVVLDEA